MNKQTLLLKLAVGVLLIAIGVASRTLFNLPPNVEIVTVISLLAGFYLQGIYSVVVPLGIMIGSDYFIGNSSIMVFTWSAYVIGGIAGKVLKMVEGSKVAKKFLRNDLLRVGVLSELSGILFVLFFFLYTNFGVVVMSNWYPHTLQGLMQSYIMGLPFLRPQLVTSVVVVPVVFVGVEMGLSLVRKWNWGEVLSFSSWMH